MAAFKCKIVNSSTHDLIIKIVGAGNQLNLHLNQGDHFITPPGQFLVEGQRIAIGWDDFTEDIVASGPVTIDKKKVITLKDGAVTKAATDTVSEADDSTL